MVYYDFILWFIVINSIACAILFEIQWSCLAAQYNWLMFLIKMLSYLTVHRYSFKQLVRQAVWLCI